MWRDEDQIELTWETPVNKVRQAPGRPELPLGQNCLPPLISEDT